MAQVFHGSLYRERKRTRGGRHHALDDNPGFDRLHPARCSSSGGRCGRHRIAAPRRIPRRHNERLLDPAMERRAPSRWKISSTSAATSASTPAACASTAPSYSRSVENTGARQHVLMPVDSGGNHRKGSAHAALGAAP
jgi:hypothetical protein